VREGGQYPVGPVKIEVDSVELVPFASITVVDIRRSGERDRESLRQRAAHAGPIADDTLLYRVEFTSWSPRHADHWQAGRRPLRSTAHAASRMDKNSITGTPAGRAAIRLGRKSRVVRLAGRAGGVVRQLDEMIEH
jgi:hypothetical protein